MSLAVIASDELREKIATAERAIAAADAALSALAPRLMEAHKILVEEEARAMVDVMTKAGQSATARPSEA
jgi:hypothetical protein